MTLKSMLENLKQAMKRAEEGNPFAAEGYLQTAKEEYGKLGEKQKEEIKKEFEEKTKQIFSRMSKEIMTRAEEFAENWREEKFSWTLAGLAEMVENAEEYALKAGEEKPKPSEKVKRLIKLVYNQFLKLDVGKARMMKKRKDYPLAESYLGMALEILERAKQYGFYTEKEAEEWRKKVSEEKKLIDE